MKPLPLLVAAALTVLAATPAMAVRAPRQQPAAVRPSPAGSVINTILGREQVQKREKKNLRQAERERAKELRKRNRGRNGSPHRSVY